MKTKKVDKVITKRLNWSTFKEAPYLNPDMSQQPLFGDSTDQKICSNQRMFQLSERICWDLTLKDLKNLFKLENVRIIGSPN